MTLTHVHLLLNHFPTVGFSVGLGLFISAFVRRNDDLKRTSLVILFLMAAMTIVTYASGSDAGIAIRDNPGVSGAAIDLHESAALVAFLFMQLTGLFAWIGLWTWRRTNQLAAWNAATILVLSIATFGLMARAANLGGEIRHPEILSAPAEEGADPTNGADGAAVAAPTSGADPTDGPDRGTGEAAAAPATIARSWARYNDQRPWVWPTAETLHFIGLSILLGVVLTVNLRMLGVGKRLSFAALYQLLPLGMAGFTIMVATGMMFLVATPQQYTGWLFFSKMILVVLGAINILYFMMFDGAWTVDEGSDAPAAAKAVAVSAIVIWIAVLACGRLLPFLGNSF